MGAFNWWGQLVIREYKKNSLILNFLPVCKHFENIEGWIQISILDVLFFVRRKTPSYNYLVKKLFCLLTIILPHILSVYMLVLFISLFASLLALVILVLSLPGCKFLLSMNWIYETQKNKT